MNPRRNLDPVQIAKWHAAGISGAEIARRLGVARSGEPFQRAMSELRKTAMESVRPAPDGYYVKGTSTLVDESGNTKLQWIKTTADMETLRAAQAAVLRSMTAKLPAFKRVAAPKVTNDLLLTLYTMTDCHVGMLAWSRETGEPWDLAIAERCLTEILCQMVDAAPASAVGMLNQLGDFLHFDSLSPMTPTNHHILDADSRYQKVVEVAVRIIENMVLYMLKKHAEVWVYLKEGNHDPAGSVWLRVMFARVFRGNPRVKVDTSPNPYSAVQWGKTFLGVYHGHLAKPGGGLPLIFAEQFSRMWGDTTFRYVHTGHKHHVEEKEFPGIKWLQHPTLASPDAYASRGGWLSKRQATSVTYHKNRGEFARQIFIPEEA